MYEGGNGSLEAGYRGARAQTWSSHVTRQKCGQTLFCISSALDDPKLILHGSPPGVNANAPVLCFRPSPVALRDHDMARRLVQEAAWRRCEVHVVRTMSSGSVLLEGVPDAALEGAQAGLQGVGMLHNCLLQSPLAIQAIPPATAAKSCLIPHLEPDLTLLI